MTLFRALLARQRITPMGQELAIRLDKMVTILVKICRKCGESKPRNCFNPSRWCKDGLNSYCKSCHKEYSRSWRISNPWKSRVSNIKSSTQYQKTEAGKAARKIYEKQNQDKIKARSAVKYAVRVNKLVPPSDLLCRTCHGPAQEYHHWSYLKENWLDVIPLCRGCHGKEHTTI